MEPAMWSFDQQFVFLSQRCTDIFDLHQKDNFERFNDKCINKVSAQTERDEHGLAENGGLRALQNRYIRLRSRSNNTKYIYMSSTGQSSTFIQNFFG
jgi:hypothetical protein